MLETWWVEGNHYEAIAIAQVKGDGDLGLGSGKWKL